jgi:hypothetical protein
LSLKALFNKCKCFNSKERLHRIKAVKVRKDMSAGDVKNCVNEYEPSNATNVRDSSPWRWRRVGEWDQYMNDPVEKLSGHIVT